MPPLLRGVIHRRVLEVIEQRLDDEPVIALQGPRSVGKSTLLRMIAGRRGVGVIDLDDPAVRDALAADTSTFLSGPRPVCVDEYQHLPVVLDAIKASLNRDLRPGAFVITGSTRYDALPLAAQSLTGRLHLMTILPFSQGELAGQRENLLARLLDDPEGVVHGPSSRTTRTQYIHRITAGGFPLALRRSSESARNRWFDDYIRLVLNRDVLDLSRVRQQDQLPSLLARLAGQTGQVLNITKAAESIKLERTTAENYTRLLEAVFLVDRLPAWGATLRARATAHPKLHVLDSGVAARLLRLTPAKLGALDPTSLAQFGHLLETFVVGELRKQATWLEGIAGSGHWRTHDGDEVDLVIERDDGRVVAFEVKTGTRVPGPDMRHLRKLRDAVGDQFIAGIAMYTGERSYTVDDRLHVMPVDRIWTPVA